MKLVGFVKLVMWEEVQIASWRWDNGGLENDFTFLGCSESKERLYWIIYVRLIWSIFILIWSYDKVSNASLVVLIFPLHHYSLQSLTLISYICGAYNELLVSAVVFLSASSKYILQTWINVTS